jgi:uncharacterized protein YuzE
MNCCCCSAQFSASAMKFILISISILAIAVCSIKSVEVRYIQIEKCSSSNDTVVVIETCEIDENGYIDVALNVLQPMDKLKVAGVEIINSAFLLNKLLSFLSALSTRED